MTRNKIKTIFSLVIISVFAFSLGSSQHIIVHASNIPAAVDNLSTSMNQLIEARDGSVAGVLPEEEDIARRKKIVSDVLVLSLKEIQSAREKLDAAEFDKESDLEKIRISILEWLDLQEAWFRKAEEKLSAEKLNLDDIRSLAKEIKTHRDEEYNKEIVNVLNFILTIETQRLTNIASDRWDKISSDLRRIEKAGLIQKDLFAGEMREAKKMIDGARALVARSFSVIQEIYLPPPKATEVTPDKAVIPAEKIPSARDLCGAAIVNLRSGYGEFVKISVSVRKLLQLP